MLSGEREAFGPLLLRHYPGLLGLCRRIVGDADRAQDTAQEAALQAYLGLYRLRDPDRFGPWLYAIGANLARSALRERRLWSVRGGPPREGVTVLWSAAPPTPEDVSAAREAHDEVMAALNIALGRQPRGRRRLLPAGL